MIKVTEEQIEAGVVAYFYTRDTQEVWGPDELVRDIYLAMRAKEAPCPDDVERVRAAIFEARYPGVSMAGRESWCINEARAALSSIQGVRTSLGTDGGEL